MNFLAVTDPMLIWNSVGALSNLVSTIVITVTAILAYRQLRQSVVSSGLDSTMAVLRYVEDPEHRKVRQSLRTTLTRVTLFEITKDSPSINVLNERIVAKSGGVLNLDDVRQYMMRMEHLCMLGVHRLVSKEIFQIYLAGTLESHWQLLLPLINYYREKHYKNPRFLQHWEMVTLSLPDVMPDASLLRPYESRRAKHLLQTLAD